MLGISFLELMPESLMFASWELVALSFLGGIVIFKAIDQIIPHIHPELLSKEQKSVERSVQALVTGIIIHNVPEGLAIGLGFALDPSMGILIALSIAIQDIPENIATIVPLYCLKKCRIRAFTVVVITILFELVGFLVGFFLLAGASLELLGASLAMAAGLMVYISLDELLPAAQIRKYPKAGITALVLGVLTVLALGLLV
jgi:ZIP family zinc transporter